MEQTINQFSKGLQLDTNPMVQSNDTLSDALNATFITQNGNEVILQNDMGNRRVDNAFLPPGYEPVGIKEYGGIIYIAAYNPVTNRSQIGSFPSPERKISQLDDPNLKNTVDFIGDFRKSVKQNYGLYWLTSDTLLYPLTNKNSLHTGDKFVVYGFTDEESIKNVTNYDNIDENEETKIKKVKTPLNKTYTLQLGVLNSQNEFVDITKTLIRWDENDNRIQFEGTETDLFKFNKGYFLAKGNEDNNDLHDTINDSNFTSERLAQKLALNTYAYKLIGPMYLKAILNHIEEFSYSIRGSYRDQTETTTGIADLIVEAIIKYNCPHKNSTDNDIANDIDYSTFDEGIVNWDNFFDFYYTDSKRSKSFFIEPDNSEHKTIAANRKSEPTTFTTTYDKLTNLYTIKITKKYSNIRNNNDEIKIVREEDGDKIYYILGVCTPQMEYLRKNSEEVPVPVYLEGLSVIDVINLNLLGSGTIISKEWRFYNNNNTTELTYGLEVYPKEGYKLVNLYADFYEVKENINWMQPSATRFLAEEIQNRNTVTFSWKPSGDKNIGEILPRKMYYVKLKYQIMDEAGENYYKYNVITKELIMGLSGDYIYSSDENIWFLSTSLFNNSYKQSDKYYIKCYFDRRNQKEEDNFKKLCTVNIKLNPNDNITELEEKKDTYGQLITSEPNNDDYTVQINKSIKFTYNPSIEIVDLEKYPDNVTLAYNQINVNYKTIYQYNNIEYSKDSNGDIISNNASKLIDVIQNSVEFFTSPSYRKSNINDDIVKINEVQSSNQININIVSNNIFRTIRESNKDVLITNAFNNFYDVIEPAIVNRLLENEQGAGIVISEYDDDSIPIIEIESKSDRILLVYFNNNEHELFGSSSNHKKWFSFPFKELDYDTKEMLNPTNNNFSYCLYSGNAMPSQEDLEKVYEILSEKFKNTDNNSSDFLFLFNITNNVKPQKLGLKGNYWDVNKKSFLFSYNDTRVWWRAQDKENNEKWVQLYTPLEINYDNRSSENQVKDSLIKYFKSIFKDFIYCYINNTNAKDAGVYVPVNYQYTRDYKVPIKIYNKLTAIIGENYVNNGNYNSSPLIFTNNTILKKNSQAYSYTIKYDEDFLDAVSVNFNQLNNIYVKTGEKLEDLNGIYYSEDNKLSKRDHEYILIDRNPKYEFNRILFKFEKGNDEHLYQYDFRWGEDDYDFYVNYNEGIKVTPSKQI